MAPGIHIGCADARAAMDARRPACARRAARNLYDARTMRSRESSNRIHRDAAERSTVGGDARETVSRMKESSTRDARAARDARDEHRAHIKFTHPFASSQSSFAIATNARSDEFHHSPARIHPRAYLPSSADTIEPDRSGFGNDDARFRTRARSRRAKTHPVMAEEENCAVADMAGANRRRVRTTTTTGLGLDRSTDRSTDRSRAGCGRQWVH